MRWFSNDFHERGSHEWKTLPNRFTSEKKISIHDNPYIILFLTCYFMPWSSTQTHENNHQLLISLYSARMIFSDLALWHHHILICDVTQMWGTGIVTSYLSIVLACANWCKGYFHSWITTMNMNFLPPGIHGLAWKNAKYYMHLNPYTDNACQWWPLLSLATGLFVQQFVQGDIKQNIKAPHYWPFEREINGDQWILLTKGQ